MQPQSIIETIENSVYSFSIVIYFYYYWNNLQHFMHIRMISNESVNIIYRVCRKSPWYFLSIFDILHGVLIKDFRYRVASSSYLLEIIKIHSVYQETVFKLCHQIPVSSAWIMTQSKLTVCNDLITEMLMLLVTDSYIHWIFLKISFWYVVEVNIWYSVETNWIDAISYLIYEW